jgi:hypothetical protein
MSCVTSEPNEEIEENDRFRSRMMSIAPFPSHYPNNTEISNRNYATDALGKVFVTKPVKKKLEQVLLPYANEAHIRYHNWLKGKDVEEASRRAKISDARKRASQIERQKQMLDYQNAFYQKMYI